MPFPTKRSNKTCTPASNARSLTIYIAIHRHGDRNAAHSASATETRLRLSSNHDMCHRGGARTIHSRALANRGRSGDIAYVSASIGHCVASGHCSAKCSAVCTAVPRDWTAACAPLAGDKSRRPMPGRNVPRPAAPPWRGVVCRGVVRGCLGR